MQPAELVDQWLDENHFENRFSNALRVLTRIPDPEKREFTIGDIRERFRSLLHVLCYQLSIREQRNPTLEELQIQLDVQMFQETDIADFLRNTPIIPDNPEEEL